jgi:hypothetical protein
LIDATTSDEYDGFSVANSLLVSKRFIGSDTSTTPPVRSGNWNPGRTDRLCVCEPSSSVAVGESVSVKLALVVNSAS